MGAVEQALPATPIALAEGVQIMAVWSTEVRSWPLLECTVPMVTATRLTGAPFTVTDCSVICGVEHHGLPSFDEVALRIDVAEVHAGGEIGRWPGRQPVRRGASSTTEYRCSAPR